MDKYEELANRIIDDVCEIVESQHPELYYYFCHFNYSLSKTNKGKVSQFPSCSSLYPNSFKTSF